MSAQSDAANFWDTGTADTPIMSTLEAALEETTRCWVMLMTIPPMGTKAMISSWLWKNRRLSRLFRQ
jgi:hypothetical protein